jgi:hypothetical protein
MMSGNLQTQELKLWEVDVDHAQRDVAGSIVARGRYDDAIRAWRISGKDRIPGCWTYAIGMSQRKMGFDEAGR